MRQLSNGVAMSEARRFKTLVLGRSVGSGASAVALPQATAQNQIIIADATSAWTLLAAPTAEGQVPVTGADPYTPAWGTTFPAVIQFDAGLTFGGATGVNVVTVPDGALQAMHIVDSGGTEFVRIRTDGLPIMVFNEGGADVDFRWEAVGQSNALNIEGSTGWVSILTSSHDAPFQVNGAIRGGYDTDTRSYFGRVAIGNQGVSDEAALGHLDVLNVADYAIKQGASGATTLNTAGGQILYLSVGNVNRATLAAGEVVFNETGADVDHRWEASGQANALFIQGSDGNVGLGTDDPAGILHLYRTTNTQRRLVIDAQGSSNLQTAVIDLITLGDGMKTVGDAATLGWHLTARGNAYTTAAQQNDFHITYWDGSTYTHVLLLDHTGNVHITENSTTVRLSGTETRDWVIAEPAVDTIGQIRIPWNCTVTRIDANVQGGTSCTFNIEERGTLGSAGTNILSSDMVADANGESVTSSFNNSSLAAGNYLTIDISAVSGAVDFVSITLTITID